MPNCAKKGRDNLQSNLNRKNMEVIEFLKNFVISLMTQMHQKSRPIQILEN